MREILFKGKQVDNGKWVRGYLCKYHEFGENIKMGMQEKYYIIAFASENVMNRYEVQPETICQFTGMIDKNDKKIWENDILRYEWDGKTRVDVIKYDPPIFTYSSAMRWNLGQDEVLGNIFDNSELLSEVSK